MQKSLEALLSMAIGDLRADTLGFLSQRESFVAFFPNETLEQT
jgi:hypothetical protein